MIPTIPQSMKLINLRSVLNRLTIVTLFVLRSSVRGDDNLEKTLVSHTWSWLAAGAENDYSLAFTFGADGIVTSSTGLKFRWKSVGPRMLKIESPDGRAALLTFDETARSFETLGFDGKTKITGVQRDLIAAKTPVPSIPGSAPAVSPPPPAKSTGIAIAGIRADAASILMATGGHSQEIQDLRALLHRYGTPKADVGLHPGAEIYPGIPYLMPWHEAEKRLVPAGNTATRSGDKIACAGFPEGLNWICYDGLWKWNGGAYNHLYILKDILNQVVSIEFRNEHGCWVKGPPWESLPGGWHVIDYINAEVKGQKDIVIETQVLDQRDPKHRIVVHTTNQKINHTATMFLPQPLINLILYVTRTSPGQK
jgi:hypothetical protein